MKKPSPADPYKSNCIAESLASSADPAKGAGGEWLHIPEGSASDMREGGHEISALHLTGYEHQDGFLYFSPFPLPEPFAPEWKCCAKPTETLR